VVLAVEEEVAVVDPAAFVAAAAAVVVPVGPAVAVTPSRVKELYAPELQ